MSETGTITKAELSDALFDQVGLNKREAKDLIDSFFEAICKSLEADASRITLSSENEILAFAVGIVL